MQANTPETTDQSNATMKEAYPLSLEQRLAWRLQNHAGLHGAQIWLRINCAVDESVLRGALAALCGRYEILRTTFQQVPGMAVPFQSVRDHGNFSWTRHDLAKLPAAEQVREIEQLAEAERKSPFDYEQELLPRALLIALGPSEAMLVLTVPSVVADRRSMCLLASDLDLLYSESTADLLEKDPVQYIEYTLWQNDLLNAKDEHSRAAEAFWSKTRDVGDEPCILPFQSAQRSVDNAGHSLLRFELPWSVVEAAEKLAEQTDTSVAFLCEAVWAVLLGRFSNVTTLNLCHRSDGRSYPDIANVIGVLAKSLPLHLSVESSKPFSLLLRELKNAVLETTGWEEYYNPERHVSADPASSAFEYEDWSDIALPPLFSIVEAVRPEDTIPLELRCRRTDTGLSISLAYDVRLYSKEDIRYLSESYQELLVSALHSPDSALGSLNMLPASERHRILDGWNSTNQSFADVPSVHSLFEEWALRTPDAPALVFEDQSLSYRELDTRANQLAHSLKKRGVGPDALVGLCLERSLEMIVGLLGILKAGGAYVALDPSLPASRLSGMLEDSGVKLVVTHSSVSSLVSGCDLVQLDTDWSEISQESISSLPSTDLVSHPAYVIYTSGSTGKPKGVVIEHGQLLNYVQGVSSRLGLPSGSSYASVSTLSADLGNTCVYGSLCTGGVLHVISETRSMDPSGWRSYLSTHRVDCLKIVPSHLSALLGSDATQQSLPEQVLVLGGEASSWDLISRIHGLSSSVRIFNHYGPTETTVGVLTYAVAREAGSVGSVTVPLGRPLPNSRVYVLNSELSPVPVGVAGELYIGGTGVGRGYLGREDLTKERFLPDPFASASTARMYKTGDVVRWLEGGVLEFLGRSDDQVKVRGFRIELGEIESVLLSHVSVRSCVVLAREVSSGERRLVAYVVCEGDAPGSGVLKEHLRSELPEYMVPSDVVYLKRLPLTSNGKVDRNALPSPEDVSEGSSYVGPRTSVEEVLCGIWCELLGRDRVSVDDSFFDLGGHSLLATQVVSRVRETFAVDVPLRALFDAPTVQGFAERIEQQLNVAKDEEAETLARLLSELEQMSEEQVKARLSEMNNG